MPAGWSTYDPPVVANTLICLIHQANTCSTSRSARGARFVQRVATPSSWAAARMRSRQQHTSARLGASSRRPRSARVAASPWLCEPPAKAPRVGSQFWAVQVTRSARAGVSSKDPTESTDPTAQPRETRDPIGQKETPNPTAVAQPTTSHRPNLPGKSATSQSRARVIPGGRRHLSHLSDSSDSVRFVRHPTP